MDAYAYGGPGWLAIRQTRYQRKHLIPLAGTPWLVQKPPAASPLLIVGCLWVLLFLDSLRSGAVIIPAFLTLVAVFVGGFYAVFAMQRAQTQVCPKCLRGMSRGATSCPTGHEVREDGTLS